MNDHWIDALARRFHRSSSRRHALGLALGISITALTSRDQIAQAGCKKVGKKCDKNKDCCAGATCQGGKCKCKSGRADCDDDGKCERATNDDTNCGACGNTCADDENCRNGTCQTCLPNTPVFTKPTETCQQDADCCDGGFCCTFDDGPEGLITGCYDLLSHTTACGLSCDAVSNCFNSDQICVNGECVGS